LPITLDQLKINQTAIIGDFDIEVIPLKLIEMGCLPGNKVELLQIAPLGDPLFFNINECFLAIRRETACQIAIDFPQ
jgi:ferrous iron transport protein A